MSDKKLIEIPKESLTYLGEPNRMTITTGTIITKDILNKK